MSEIALREVIDLVGSQAELARRIGNGIKPAHVWNWLNRDGGIVPADQAIPVARASEWRRTPHDIRPDLYPNPDDGLPPELRGKRRHAA